MGGITIMFFDYWALLGAVLALDYYQKFREREKEAAELQLRTLQLETKSCKSAGSSFEDAIKSTFSF